MSRELKFRVWNIIESRWNGAYNQEPKMVGELCCHKGIYLIPESASRNLITQQYTGLKDKNGVEIYEGDILKHNHKVQQVESKLDWNCGCCGFVYGYSIEDPNDIEVIGNIFENPELLNNERNKIQNLG